MKKSQRIKNLIENLESFVITAPLTNEQLELMQKTTKALNDYAAWLADYEEELKMSKVNTKWTDEEDKKLAEEYKKGWKIARISKKHMRGMSGIVSRLNKLGLLADSDENGKKRWTDEEDAALLKQAESGKSVEKMAELHGRSMSGILARLEKLGYDIDER